MTEIRESAHEPFAARPVPTEDDAKASLAEHARLREAYIAGLLNPPDARPVGYLVVTLLLVVVLVGAFAVRTEIASPGPDCSAAPGPGISWENCKLGSVEYEFVRLSGAKLSNADLSGAILLQGEFVGLDGAYVNLDGAQLTGSNLSNAHLLGASFRNANLRETNFEGANLSYANFVGADLSGAVIKGAKLGNALWPDGNVCLPDSIGGCLVN